MALATRLRRDRFEGLTIMRALVYCRVSTDAQERDGTSLDTQERAAVKVARESGYSVTETVRDTASGFTFERSGIEPRPASAQGRRRRHRAGLRRRPIVPQPEPHRCPLRRGRPSGGSAGVRDGGLRGHGDRPLHLGGARVHGGGRTREDRRAHDARQRGARAKREASAGYGQGDVRLRVRPEHRDSADHHRNRQQSCGGSSERSSRVGRATASRTILNRDRVPAFSGGRWYALTIRRLLKNEAFAGRTIYRRTRADRVRDVARGRGTRRVVERDQSEWIEVAGATPAIIDRGVFDAAQKILNDPSRRPQTAPSDVYLLRGRISCRECGARMVGHASNRGRYRYYRCPNGSSGPGETTCESRYIRIERLEGAVRTALTDLLASPDRLLGEAKRLAAREPRNDELEKVLQALGEVESAQGRLVRLYTTEALPEHLLREESRVLAERREVLENTRRELQAQTVPTPRDFARIAGDVPAALSAIRHWVEDASGDDFDLLLRAVDAQVRPHTKESRSRASCRSSQIEIRPISLPLNKHRHDHVDVALAAHGAEDTGVGGAGGLQGNAAAAENLQHVLQIAAVECNLRLVAL